MELEVGFYQMQVRIFALVDYARIVGKLAFIVVND